MKPSADRKCRRSTEVRMWPCARGAFAFSFSDLAISTDVSALREAARLPGGWKTCRPQPGSGERWRVPALRRPYRPRAFAPCPPGPPSPAPAKWPHQGAKNSTSMRPAEPVSEMRLSKLSSVSSSTSEAAARRAAARSSARPGNSARRRRRMATR